MNAQTPSGAPIDSKSHNTVVMGWNADGSVAFCKTYDYETQEEEAQSDLKHVIDHYPTWQIGDVTTSLKQSRFKSEETENEEA